MSEPIEGYVTGVRVEADIVVIAVACPRPHVSAPRFAEFWRTVEVLTNGKDNAVRIVPVPK